MMRFDNGEYLYFLFVIPVFIVFSLRSYSRRKKWLCLFAGKKKKPGPDLAATVIFSLMLATLVVSVAGPRIQYHKTVFNRSGIEIAVGIDVSKSMLAEDVNFPESSRLLFTVFNRLNRARSFVLSLIPQLQGERLGAYIFADKGIEIIPFTNDYGYCSYILKHINASELTLPGSNLADAVKTGLSMFEASSHRGIKALLLFSDGEDISADADAIDAAVRLAAEKRIRIYTVGIGTGKPALIPIRNEEGNAIRSYLLDEDGTHLKTGLVQETLLKIATSTGGVYFRGNEENAPQKLIASILQNAHGMDETKRLELAWLDLSAFLLSTALALLIMEIFIHPLFSKEF